MSQKPEPKPPVRRPRKTPEQRGEVGWWAYRTMDALFLTDEQIAARVGVGSPAIRKFMGSPKGELGADSRRKLLAYYREVALASGTPIDEPPEGFIAAMAASGTTAMEPGAAAYLARIDALVAQMAADRALIRELLDRLTPKPPTDDVQAARDAIGRVLDQAGDTPSPLRSVPDAPSEEARHTVPAGNGTRPPAPSASTHPSAQ